MLNALASCCHHYCRRDSESHDGATTQYKGTSTAVAIAIIHVTCTTRTTPETVGNSRAATAAASTTTAITAAAGGGGGWPQQRRQRLKKTMTALSLGLRFVHNLRFHPGSFGSPFPLLQVVWMMKILGAALGKDFANLPAYYTPNPMAEGGKRILSDKGNPTRAGGRTRQTRTSRWQRSLAPGLTWNVRFRQHGTANSKINLQNSSSCKRLSTRRLPCWNHGKSPTRVWRYNTSVLTRTSFLPEDQPRTKIPTQASKEKPKAGLLLHSSDGNISERPTCEEPTVFIVLRTLLSDSPDNVLTFHG